MEKFKLTIATPQKKLFDGEAESVTVPGTEGGMMILAGHAPLLSTLTSGEVKVATGSAEKTFEIGGGFIDVTENGATVLVKNASE